MNFLEEVRHIVHPLLKTTQLGNSRLLKSEEIIIETCTFFPFQQSIMYTYHVAQYLKPVSGKNLNRSAFYP